MWLLPALIIECCVCTISASPISNRRVCVINVVESGGFCGNGVASLVIFYLVRSVFAKPQDTNKNQRHNAASNGKEHAEDGGIDNEHGLPAEFEVKDYEGDSVEEAGSNDIAGPSADVLCLVLKVFSDFHIFLPFCVIFWMTRSFFLS